MARRVSPAQFRAQLRRAESQARRAQRDLKRAVRDYNADARKVNRAIDDYNSKARQHNARVRANRQRLQRELARLQSSRSTRTTTRTTTYRVSMQAFQTSYQRLVDSGAEARLPAEWIDLGEGEAANSVAAMNAINVVEGDGDDTGADRLADTTIQGELAEVDADLDRRWRGALFALDPRNPDAARHFCTSARELLTKLLAAAAPDEAVVAADPEAPRTEQGTITRRARIHYCLASRGHPDEQFADFVEEDIKNVLELFRVFNDGTHGSAGRFGVGQLKAVKTRVEDAVKFIHRVAFA